MNDVSIKVKLDSKSDWTLHPGQLCFKKVLDNLVDCIIKVYSDFVMEKQPTTLEDTLQVYQDISKNFGLKDLLYNHSVPMSVILMPLQTVSDSFRQKPSSKL